MDLNRWEIDSDFLATNPQGENDFVAKCHVDWQYKRAQLKWVVPCLVQTETCEELERIVVHELLHIIVHPMRKCWNNTGDAAQFDIWFEERVVSELTGVLIRTRNAERDAKLKAMAKPKRNARTKGASKR